MYKAENIVGVEATDPSRDSGRPLCLDECFMDGQPATVQPRDLYPVLDGLDSDKFED